MDLFGPDHLAALGATGAFGAVVVAYGRRRDDPAVARSLAYVILAALLADPVIAYGLGYFSLARSLPLDLCDAAAVAAAVALVTRHPFAFELAYFWGLSGTLQALLTPVLPTGFPHPDFFRYFVLHIGIVVGVLYLAAGTGMRPREGAVGRVYFWTAVYTAGIGLVDWALGANYMFLCRKPPGSVLEPFGPWPWYILAGAWIGAGLFYLLDLPHRRARRAARG